MVKEGTKNMASRSSFTEYEATRFDFHQNPVHLPETLNESTTVQNISLNCEMVLVVFGWRQQVIVNPGAAVNYDPELRFLFQHTYQVPFQ